ncbi:ferritin family protein [Proteiniclasticum sp. QWL-01]|uniref:ferritin-like domain-containing protein n=1 Tax=Proteiniclasticum sp. QWL-01 TaxID=3036945 RepID=UPI0022096294|nr:ferritin family protein [Proteiniclasticum sp. QWL-01]UUM13068.1 ferritin family protein [Clostridiaceae bacterium HFYG-1003]WFF71490.1 ferritin family protein [Proteiniclasticum sp. QWL-01]
MDHKVINILKYALDMELAGHNFFKEKASQFTNPTTQAIFLNLAEVEQEHYNLIKKELDQYTANPEGFQVNEEVLKRDESTIFQQRQGSEALDTTLVESDVPDLTILRMAYLIERDFKEFYGEAQDMVEDENVKTLLKRLADWEQGHETLFRREYDRLKKEYLNLPWGG